MSRATRPARDRSSATRHRTNDRRALSAPVRRSRVNSPRTANASSRSSSRSRPKASSRSRSRSRTRTSSSSSSRSSTSSHLALSNRLEHSHVASNASAQLLDTNSAFSNGHRRPTPFIRKRVGVKSRIVGALGNGLNYFKGFFQDGAKLGRALGRRCKVQFTKFVLYRCVGGRAPDRIRRIRYEDETVEVAPAKRGEWSRNTRHRGRCSQCGRSSMSSSERPGGLLPAHLRFDSSISGPEERSGSASPSRVDHYPSKAGSASSRRGSNSARDDESVNMIQ